MCSLHCTSAVQKVIQSHLFCFVFVCCVRFLFFGFFYIFSLLEFYVFNVVPFLSFLSRNMQPHPPPLLPASMRCSLTHPQTPSHLLALTFSYIGALSLNRDLGPILPFMPNKATLSYLCDYSHRYMSVYSCNGGFVSLSFGGGCVWLVDIVALMRLKTPLAPSVLSQTPPFQTSFSVH